MTKCTLMFTGMLLAAAQSACAYGDPTEALGAAEEGVGGSGTDCVSPQAIDAASLSRGVTNEYGITTPFNADALQICLDGTVSANGCIMRPEWAHWLLDVLHGGSSAPAHAEM